MLYQVKEIKRRIKNYESNVYISKQLNIGVRKINRIRTKQTWQNITI